jgi:hypothetical protein
MTKQEKKLEKLWEGDDWDMYSGYILELMMVVPSLFPFSGSRSYGLQFNTSGWYFMLMFPDLESLLLSFVDQHFNRHSYRHLMLGSGLAYTWIGAPFGR